MGRKTSAEGWTFRRNKTENTDWCPKGQREEVKTLIQGGEHQRTLPALRQTDEPWKSETAPSRPNLPTQVGVKPTQEQGPVEVHGKDYL
jgi:hypothetical protein